MPKRADIKSILIIGAGPIIIGQACEFDYSGVQACRALRALGYKIILVNSNPATIMTDPHTADVVYIEPILPQTVARIIERERPDALLPTMGGQTALNCALALERAGVLEKYHVEMIGARAESIDKAEDRQKFKEAMTRIGLESARSGVAHSIEEAYTVQNRIATELGGSGYPVVIRPSFTLGGSGGGIAYNRDEFEAICKRGLEASPTKELLIEESLLGWKEFEMEVVRDCVDNCIIVCCIENLDPMGIHTGDSITVAPAQTLTDKEYQRMRNASIAILREIGVDTGGSNVQFAVNPQDGRMIVIEMNPRVSRSSALASKATGFPIAKIAARLAVGFTLDELKNDITQGQTPASFEPTLDYVVVKVPRFAFEKFPDAEPFLTTQMKSVGEVMAMGRTFQEALQKALRSLEVGMDGFGYKSDHISEIKGYLGKAGPDRIWYVGDAFEHGLSVEEVHHLTHIDPWFLEQIQDIIKTEQQLTELSLADLNKELLRSLKRQGFSDKRLAYLLNTNEQTIRLRRWQDKIHPVYKRIDTCAAEFATSTAYLYSTYEEECEALPSNNKKVMILGGGPNRIGQGIEFDYCCVHAVMALREAGYETIMVNCNPETVSTDYDISDRLYFEPVTLEDVLEIVEIEKPMGVIVQLGGQTPLKLCRDLEKAEVKILGTSPDSIDIAEDRERFGKLVEQLKLLQPQNRTARRQDEALLLAKQIGFPLMVRPSYVLGGRAMEVIHESGQLERYLREAIEVSNNSPILLDSFLSDAIEVDVDCVSDGEEVHIGGIMQHIEEAGVHSGDSACCLPPWDLSQELQDKLRQQTRLLAQSLNVVGLMNVQFAICKDKNKDGEMENVIYVLEVNPRASRTIPFVSKATGRPLAKIAALCMVGKSLREQNVLKEIIPPFFSVKEAVFPFIKFQGVDPLLGPEMKSTGEVMGIGHTFGEAFLKSQLAAGAKLPRTGKIFISVNNKDKEAIVSVAEELVRLGFTLVATHGTAQVLKNSKVPVQTINKLREGRPHIVDAIKNHEIALVINTPGIGKNTVADSREMRISALQQHIPYYTTVAGAHAVTEGLKQMLLGDGAPIRALHEWYTQLSGSSQSSSPT